jgi:hypothetical protein
MKQLSKNLNHNLITIDRSFSIKLSMSRLRYKGPDFSYHYPEELITHRGPGSLHVHRSSYYGAAFLANQRNMRRRAHQQSMARNFLVA